MNRLSDQQFVSSSPVFGMDLPNSMAPAGFAVTALAPLRGQAAKPRLEQSRSSTGAGAPA